MRLDRAFALVMLTALGISTAVSSASSSTSLMEGGYVITGAPLGDWREIAGFPLGIDATNIVRMGSDKPFSLRSSLGVLYNFSRTVDVPQENLGPNSALSLTTKNWSLLFGIGPELSKPTGDLRPFVYGTVGFDTYWTSSELKGTAGGVPFSQPHGDSRIGFAWAAGFGARRWVGSAETVELSAEYRSGQGHRYILPDEVTNTGTTVHADRAARNTDQLVIRIGTTFGH